MQLIKSIAQLLLRLHELQLKFGDLLTENAKALVLLLHFHRQLVVLHVYISPAHLSVNKLLLEVVGTQHLLSQCLLQLAHFCGVT